MGVSLSQKTLQGQLRKTVHEENPMPLSECSISKQNKVHKSKTTLRENKIVFPQKPGNAPK